VDLTSLPSGAEIFVRASFQDLDSGKATSEVDPDGLDKGGHYGKESREHDQ
jgi:hypothetical protein